MSSTLTTILESFEISFYWGVKSGATWYGCKKNSFVVSSGKILSNTRACKMKTWSGKKKTKGALAVVKNLLHVFLSPEKNCEEIKNAYLKRDVKVSSTNASHKREFCSVGIAVRCGLSFRRNQPCEELSCVYSPSRLSPRQTFYNTIRRERLHSTFHPKSIILRTVDNLISSLTSSRSCKVPPNSKVRLQPQMTQKKTVSLAPMTIRRFCGNRTNVQREKKNVINIATDFEPFLSSGKKRLA